MAVKYGKFEMPQSVKLEEKKGDPNYAKFIAEPFERGFGHTVGNSLRRMMLTSLEAPAVVGFRFEDVPHEYMAIEGIVEDMTNIVLNVKGVLLRKLPKGEASTRSDQLITGILDISQEDLDTNKGKVEVKLGDLVQESEFEVVNPDLHLFTVTKPLKKQVIFRVSFGRGYVPSERHVVRDRMKDEILLDSAFSPVRLVTYSVENTRVGQDTDFDRLILEVRTDGRITPQEALTFASQIGVKHFESFNQLKTEMLTFEEEEEIEDTDQTEMMDKLALRIDEIELSVRSANCLSGANIETIGELVSIPERRMLEFRNFGKKSLNEIKSKLSEMHLHLGMDLSRYGITEENVKEKIRKYLEQRQERDEFQQPFEGETV